MRVPEEADRDFVSGCFLVKDEKLLMVDHSKLGVWLPPGGHVEESETPDETAKRETLEETGWKVEIIGETKNYDSFDSVDLPRPFNVNLHRVRDGHWHCDLQYLAKPVEKVEATHNHEHDGQRWIGREDLEELNAPENVKSAAKNALNKFEDRK